MIFWHRNGGRKEGQNVGKSVWRRVVLELASAYLSQIISILECISSTCNKYRLHHEVEVGMGFTQPRAEGPRIV